MLYTSPKASDSKLNLGTLNVGGLKSRPAKIAKIFEVVKCLDIIFLQETHFYTQNDANFFNQVFETTFIIFHSFAALRCTGIVIMLNKNIFSLQNYQRIFEIEGRCLGTKIQLLKRLL